jgi:hypothetical protein
MSSAPPRPVPPPCSSPSSDKSRAVAGIKARPSPALIVEEPGSLRGEHDAPRAARSDFERLQTSRAPRGAGVHINHLNSHRVSAAVAEVVGITN